MINIKIAHHKIILWILAIIITLGSAIYQRMSGPTYPKRGKVNFQANEISFKLLRTETVYINAPVTLTVPDTTIGGYVKFRRYKSHDEWTEIRLQRQGDKLIAHLPHQPPAGKLMYFVYLTKDDQQISLTGEEAIILRYKGGVPTFILLFHVFTIFFTMLLSNRTGLEALDANGKAFKYMLWTIGLFFVGGFILGPVMQQYAFGSFWTGIPFGIDLTDNKTLIAMLGWLWAWYKNRGGRDGRGWIIFAAVLMLAVYLIPHSVLGSEIDYTKLPESN
ncbi:hypothetical protein JW964_04780 [candidate division KSB1 bacterium]|nr:hypothetical protein [candidate division KSB1 bacterium]